MLPVPSSRMSRKRFATTAPGAGVNGHLGSRDAPARDEFPRSAASPAATWGAPRATPGRHARSRDTRAGPRSGAHEADALWQFASLRAACLIAGRYGRLMRRAAGNLVFLG